MTTSNQMLLIGGLLCGLALPRASYAISGCTNSTLQGTYNAQVDSINFAGALSGSGTVTAAAGSSSIPPMLTGGLSGTNTSLAGNVAGLGRFAFDGLGTIVGASVTTSGVVVPGNAAVGAYNVNNDCSITMTLNTGQTFDGVIVSSGASANDVAAGRLNQVLFVETDTAGAGVSGTLSRAPASCLGSTAQSFGFRFNGLSPAATSSGTGGSGLVEDQPTAAATGIGATALPAPNAAIGLLQLDGQGGFSFHETSFANGAVQRVTSSGTYTVGANCALQVTFIPGVATLNGTSSTSLVPALNFSGLLSTTSGGLSVQPSQGVSLTGSLIPQ